MTTAAWRACLLTMLVLGVGCEEPGATGPDMPGAGGGSGTITDSCGRSVVEAQPLYVDGPSESGPIVTVRPDGVIVTTAAGRVRPRHEREDRFAHFEAHYFKSRSYRFVIEDFVAKGESRIKVTYYPIDDVSEFGPTTNFRAWKVYGAAGNGPDHYTFADNGVLTQTSPRVLEKTVTRNARDGREMRVGDIFDFEFGVFLAGFNSQDSTSIGEGAKSYYSDTFRYQVGKGGLTPESFDDSGLVGPSEMSARLAGGLTVPFVAWADGTAIAPEMVFSQMALNIQSPHQQLFLEGRRLFHTAFDDGTHSEPHNPKFTEQAGKLGPLFNVKSCSACHEHNGRGVLPSEGQEAVSVVLKLPSTHALGRQLQPQEAKLMLTRFETKEVTLADGTKVQLQKPIFDAGRELPGSPRLARQLVGMGLLEAIDDATLFVLSDEGDCDGNGVSGRVSIVKDPAGVQRVGRFGWKAEKVSVRHQVADALDVDLGVTTSLFPGGAAPELSDDDLNRLTVYMSLLGIEPQRNASSEKVKRGAQLFVSVGCSSCHIPSLTTGKKHPYEELREQTIRPFTDLLLHDLGSELADASGEATASEWRTAPLWGVGSTLATAGKVSLLHDGRARSVLEAVLWHGGEAQRMRDAVTTLSADEREALIAFVESL
ncbi:MAG: di-heme oxidoredictase family protein [Archangium sp.]